MKKYSVIPPALHTSGIQVGVLTGAHFLVDMLGGLLPGFLPVALVYFDINLGLGVVILSSVSIGCNLMQIPASLLGRAMRSPTLLTVGLVMAGLIVLLGAMPRETPVWVLCILMVTVGCGIALVHPHGLRGTQHARKVAVSVSTPVFMTGGFLGGAVGPWLSSLLVGHYGLKGLSWLILPVVLVIGGLWLSHVKLTPDQPVQKTPDEPHTEVQSGSECPWGFANLCLIATLLNMGTTTIQALLPSYLNTLKYSLSFGGFCSMLFGIGSAVGSISIGVLVRKYRCTPFVLGGLLLGAPVMLIYFLLSKYSVACLLIPLGGLLASSCFPLLVSLSRNAEGGLSTSVRMGLIVGGTWGFAGVVLLVIGQIAARIGLAPVMHLSWIFYVCALLAAVLTLKKRRPPGKTDAQL